MEISLSAANANWVLLALGLGLGVLVGCGGQEGSVAAGGSSGSSSLGGSSGMSGSPGSGASAGVGGASGGCEAGGCSGQLCGEVGADLISTCEYLEEYACYRDARCERQSDGRCAWTETAALTECIAQARGTSTFRWYRSCGSPVCRLEDGDAGTGAPACGAEQEGESCSRGATACDPGLGCGVNLVCAASDPRLSPGGCPISRRRFKQDITALSAAERRRLSEELLRLPLVTYRYRGQDTEPQLGFVIEDVEPSYAVDAPRDQVNLYGYASMAVLALQEQQRTIAEQERRLSEQARRIEALDRQLNSLQSALYRVRAQGATPRYAEPFSSINP